MIDIERIELKIAIDMLKEAERLGELERKRAMEVRKILEDNGL